MEIYYRKEVIDTLGVGYLFIDNCSLILISSYQKEFSNILSSLKDQGKVLVTIPSIAFEFSRTDNIQVYNTRRKFLEDYVSIYPIEKHLKGLSNALTITVQKIAGNASYSDFLLYYCLYHFREAHLLTENHKDFKTAILDRETVITIDTDKDIRNTALYSFSSTKYERFAAKILKEI